MTLDPTSGYLSGCLGCEQYTTGKMLETLTMPSSVFSCQTRELTFDCNALCFTFKLLITEGAWAERSFNLGHPTLSKSRSSLRAFLAAPLQPPCRWPTEEVSLDVGPCFGDTAYSINSVILRGPPHSYRYTKTYTRYITVFLRSIFGRDHFPPLCFTALQ